MSSLNLSFITSQNMVFTDPPIIYFVISAVDSGGEASVDIYSSKYRTTWLGALAVPVSETGKDSKTLVYSMSSSVWDDLISGTHTIYFWYRSKNVTDKPLAEFTFTKKYDGSDPEPNPDPDPEPDPDLDPTKKLDTNWVEPNDESIVKMGMLTDFEFRLSRSRTFKNDWYNYGDNKEPSNFYKTDRSYCNYLFTTATKYEKEHDMEWKWIKTEIDGSEAYICTSMILIKYPITYYYDKIHNKTMCIDGKYYEFKILTHDQWTDLSTDILKKIDWNGFYTITDTDYNPGSHDLKYKVTYDKESGLDSTYAEYDSSSSSNTGLVPVLFPITDPTGYISQYGIIHDENGHIGVTINDHEGCYYFDNVTNSSGSCNWYKTNINGTELLVGNGGIMTYSAPPDIAKSYEGKTAYINGNVYKIRLLSEDDIRNLPKYIIKSINFFDYKNNGVKLYVYTTSTYEDKWNSPIYIRYDNTNNKFEIQPYAASSIDSQPYPSFGLMVGLEYIGSAPNQIKLGALKDLRRDTVYSPKKYTNQELYDNEETVYNYNFIDTDDESKKWSWIETTLNGDYILISKFGVGPAGYESILDNNYNLIGRKITLENKQYEIINLSKSDVEKLDFSVLGSMDFGYSSSASWHDFTSEITPSYDPKYVTTFSFCCYRIFGEFGLKFVKDSREIDAYYGRHAYYPVLKLLNQPPTISEQDKQLEDKVKPFVVYYSVDDKDVDDKLTITEKLNGTVYRTITNAVRKNQYSFEINSSMFSNLKLYDMNTIEIIVSDGMFSTTRTYIFRKTNTAPTINYSGSLNLGRITTKPTIDYSVHDAEGDEITVTERLNGKTIRTFTAASDTSCTVQISDDAWLSCGSDTSTVEITVRDDAGGSSNKTITFNRSIDRIEAIIKPIETTSAVTKISLDIDWDTTNASGKVFVCNNGFDDTPTWEDMTTSVGLSNAYTLTNNTKVADKWGVSVKVTIKKDEGATNEVSLYSIKGTYQ